MSEQQARATKKQQLLLEFVREFIKEHSYGPSYREIMTALDYKSVSTVAVHVDGLITKGFLRRADNSPRSLEVVDRASSSNTDPSVVSVLSLEKKADELIAASRDDASKKSQAATLIEAIEILGLANLAAELRARLEKL